MVAGTAAAVLGAAVDLAETADTDGLPEVDVAGDGGGADVEPVDVLGGHLLGGTSLDGVDPACWYRQQRSPMQGIGQEEGWNVLTGNGKLALALQESRVCRHKLVGLC